MDHPDQLASDAEREAAVAALRQHTTDGRLTLEEFEQRADDAYRSRTLGELARVGRNLPDRPSSPLPAALPSERITATLGDEKRQGNWRVPEHLELVAVLGDVTVDLRDSELPSRLTIVARATLGDVRIYVPAFARVVLSGRTFLGSKKLRGGDASDAEGPQIDVHATAILGDVIVDVQTPTEKVRGWVKRLSG